MSISNLEKIKLVMAKDFWETDDLGGKLGKIKVSDGPVGLRCLAITDSWENDSIYPAVAYPCYQMLSQTWNLSLAHKMGRAIADDCIDHNVDVLYPFGYGLSYSEFQYSDLKVEKTGDRVKVSVQVENISDTDGKEVVQLYVNEVKPAVCRPKRELKAFEKVAIKAHEKAAVTFELTESAFSYYTQEQSKWTVNPGVFAIEIGRNANEIILSEGVEYGL